MLVNQYFFRFLQDANIHFFSGVDDILCDFDRCQHSENSDIDYSIAIIYI